MNAGPGESRHVERRGERLTGWWRPAWLLRLLMVVLGTAGLSVLLLASLGRDIPFAGRAVAAAVIAGAAVAWVRLDAVSVGSSTGIWLRLAAMLCVTAGGLLALFGTGLVATRAMLLAAVVLLYVGAGDLITRWRRGTRLPLLDAALVAVTCAMLGVLGSLTFRPGADRAVWLLVAAVGLAPLGLTLVSEAVLRWLGSASGRTLLVGVGGGALMLGGPVTAGLLVTGTRQLVLVGAVLLLFITTIVVANSPGDLALVVALLAVLVALTNPPVDPTGAVEPTRAVPTLLALGDSYMSGEGASTFYAGTDRPSTSSDEHNQCRRAPTSYAAELVTGRDTRFEQLAFVACSGARARQVHSDTQYTGEPADVDGGTNQLKQASLLEDKHRFEPALVLLSIGGNDSGFSTIGVTCGGPGDCAEIEHYWLANLPAVGARVREAYEAVREQYKTAPVLVVPYPIPLPSDGDCRDIWLTQRERESVVVFARALNATLKEQAQEERFYFLDEMEDALDSREASAGRPERQSLQLCDVDTPKAGVNFIGVRSVGDALTRTALNPRNWIHNSLHPNEAGHDRMGDVVREWLNAHPVLEAEAPAEEGTIGPPPPPGPDPKCDVLDETEAGCRSLAMSWVKGEALEMRMAVYVVAGLAAAVAGAWLLAVSGIALLRRRRGAADA